MSGRSVGRSVRAFLALPVVVAGVVPWVLSRLPGPRMDGTRLGLVPVLVGTSILVASVVSFHRRGHGTLAPWDPPRRLVVQDLYRVTRNPMYVGVVTIVLGWALLTGSLWNTLFAVVVAVAFHLRVLLYEEKEMRRLFGDDWERYRRAVPRWGLRWPPYSPIERTRGGSSE